MPRGLTTRGRSISPTNVDRVTSDGVMREETVAGVTRQIYRSGSAASAVDRCRVALIRDTLGVGDALQSVSG
jgi:hypothetical protein